MVQGDELDVFRDAKQRDSALKSVNGLGICGMFFTLDGRTLIIVTVRFGISFFDVLTCTHVKSFRPFDMGILHQNGSSRSFMPTSMSPDGRFLAIVAGSPGALHETFHKAYIIDVEQCLVICVREQHVRGGNPVFSPDGAYAAFCSGEVLSTTTWEPVVSSTKALEMYNRYRPERARPFHHPLLLHGVGWSKENNLLGTFEFGCLEILVSACGVVDGSERFTEKQNIFQPIYSNDGRKILFLTRTGVEVCDRQTMAVVGNFTDFGPDITNRERLPTIESPDSRFLATATRKGVRIWDMTSFSVVRCIPQAALHLVWSPDSRKLVVGGSTCLA